jgi:phosphatidylserine/phosphatidylglycerophosphate/cardiolipin synthase-like enzyme
MIRDGAHVPFARNASYPLRAGNAVRPLVDGEPAFRRICEAVDAARSSVWVTVAFLEAGFRMPDGRSFFDVLDGAAARGLDARVIFWRSPTLLERERGTHFFGTDEDRRWLAGRGARFQARWDRLPRHFCHHQKSWLVDAGTPDEVAFVGGINLDVSSVAAPGHAARAEGNVHDVYLELRGPAATDVHHNFVQRWNGASERGRPDGAWPGPGRAGDLPFPERVSAEAGSVPVQITRTVRRETYADGRPTPDGAGYDIAKGEHSVLEQYLAALDAARRSIYFEDQTIASPAVIERIDAAARRGVDVVFLVPGNAHPEFAAARREPKLRALFEPLDALGRHANFTLAAIASHDGPRAYHDVYVHAKILLVDDAWATIGSTNVADRSFYGDTELNASFWDAETARRLRTTLLAEHLGRDTSALDDRAALALFRELARENRSRRERGDLLDGLAFAVDPARYGA